MGRRVPVVVLGALLLAGCASAPAGEPASGAQEAATTRLAAEVVQLRRDEVLERVAVAVRLLEGPPVVVESVDLQVPGYAGVGPVAKDSPVREGVVVNLPTPYGQVECGPDFLPEVGSPLVDLRVRPEAGGAARTVTLRPADPDGLLGRIAGSTCTTERLAGEVELAFGPRWRMASSDGRPVVRGTLTATLLGAEPRRLTQVAGTVIYDLDTVNEPVADDLATLTPDRPRAEIPVEVASARCDGHAIGEVKKPYAFLVWVAVPGGEERALTPAVDERSRAAFDRVCRL